MKTIALLLISLASFGQIVTPKSSVDKFFKDIVSIGTDEAITQAFASNKWMAQNQDAIKNLQDQMATLTPDTFGNFYGHEVVKEKKLGESYMMYIVMARFDRQPIRFTFEFYKPSAKWVLHGLAFDVKMEEEF
ncbi:MAG: hypothetical protein U0V04_09945 [Spirosomataceae bacterium]|jgi:hypothetical protein